MESSITGAEVIEVVKKLHGGRAPGVDEICPEFLKALDVVGLSWLTHLCNIAWTSEAVPLDRSGGFPFQEGGPEHVFQLHGNHTPQPPW